MLSKEADGNIACCFGSFEIHPIVAIYGILWYINSIYGVCLLIIESQNICFFEWYAVCIVNVMIPIIWLIIIGMVDKCCIRYWSLPKWHRRHYGAAFLYFAIFTNQTLIFGVLCLYGFNVWVTIASPPCNSSNHLIYGFIVMICASTFLILWIGIYQCYAATKYLCVYHAVLDVKKRQKNSSYNLKQHKNNNHHHHRLKIMKNGANNSSNGHNSNDKSRKFSIESRSIASVNISFIGSIFRYGTHPHDDDQHHNTDDDNDDDNDNEQFVDQHEHKIVTLKLSDNVSEEFNREKLEKFRQQMMNGHEDGITPLPSEVGDGEQLMEYRDLHEVNEDDEHEQSPSHSDSGSESRTKTETQSHIEIAGIKIPTKKFSTSNRAKKSHDHKQYKSVKHRLSNEDIEGFEESDDDDDDDKTDNIEIIDLSDEEDEKTEKIKNESIKNKHNENNDDDVKKINNLYSMPLFGSAIKMTTDYFDRMKEDPSTADLCIICYDSFKNNDILARLKCGHVYHKNCIRIWFANNHSCPLCNMNEKNLNLKLNIRKNT